MTATILVIDDDAGLRRALAKALQTAGYRVATARDGEEALDTYAQHTPDAIICDIMMPLLDGYGVLHLLSKNKDSASIPFIFLTAKSEKSDYRTGMELGADDYITKPFDETQLLNAIEVRLRKVEKLKQNFGQDLTGVTDFLESASQHINLRLTEKAREVQKYRKKSILFEEGHRPLFL